MAYTQYFGSKPVSDWTANGPAESGHNFIDQINEQSGKIASQENKYNEQYQNIGTARNAYDNQFKNMQNYSDVYQQAKGTEGVDDAKSQYQKSLNSVNATAAAMNNLPSSINANSNVVLNSNQRNAALGNQMAKYQNTMDYWTRQNQGDLSSYQTALSAAQNTANQETALQRQDTNIALDRLNTEMNMANELYNQVLNERNIMRTIYGQMYDDEYRHMQQEIEAWAKNLAAETERHKEAQANYRAQLSANAQKYAADAGLRLQDLLRKQEAEKQAKLNQAKPVSYINSQGFYGLSNGTAGRVNPIVEKKADGTQVNRYVLDGAGMAQALMAGGY